MSKNDNIYKNGIEQKKNERQQKKEKIKKKTKQIVEREFLKLFDRSILPYFIPFILGVSTIFILMLIAGGQNAEVQWFQITIALTLILTYIILLVLTRSQKIHDKLFQEGKVGLKIGIFILSLFISFIFVFIVWYLTGSEILVTPSDRYFAGPEFLRAIGKVLTGSDGNLTNIEALRYQGLFGTILMIIFFGWNIIQIWFIKNGLEVNCIKVETRYQRKIENLQEKPKNRRTGFINFFTTIFPFLFHIICSWIFIVVDAGLESPRFTGSNYGFENYKLNHPELAGFDLFSQYFSEIWWGTSFEHPLRIVFLWICIVLIIQIITTIHQKRLYQLSYKNKTPNIYSGLFYTLFWMILWLKLFMIIKTIISNETVSLEWYDQAFDYFVDFCLMLFTILMVLRGFGKKIRQLKRPWLTEYNTVLLMFIFVLTYFGGQMITITGGVAGDTRNLSISTNIIVVIVNLIFYFWYSRFVLEQQGFIQKSNYSLLETKDLLVDFSQKIKGNLLQTIENEEIIQSTLKDFMLTKHILQKVDTTEEENLISLKTQEKDLSSTERVERAQKAYKLASLDQENYENTIKSLDQSKENLKQIDLKELAQQKQLDTFPKELEIQYKQTSQNYNQMKKKSEELQKSISSIQKELQNLKIPEQNKDQVSSEQFKEIESLNKQKTKFNTEIDHLTQQQTQISTEMQNLAIKNKEIEQKLQEYRSQQKIMDDIIKDKELTNRNIEKIGKDLIILKERAEQARPALDAAAEALKKAQIELETSQKYTQAINEEKEIEKNLSNAQKKFNDTQAQLTSIEKDLLTIMSGDQIQQELLKITQQINENQEKIQIAKNNLVEKTKILSEKSDLLVSAKNILKEKSLLKEQAELNLRNAQQKLTQAQEKLKKATQLKSDLEKALELLKKTEESYNKLERVESLEQKLKEAQLREKDAKQALKEFKKQADYETRLPAVLREKTKNADQAEQQVQLVKIDLNKSRDAKNLVDSSKKQVLMLQSQQINIESVQTEILDLQNNVKDLNDAAEGPRNNFIKTEKETQTIEKEYNIVKNEENTIKNKVLQYETEIKTLENKKVEFEQLFTDRSSAEMEFSEKQALMKDAEGSLQSQLKKLDEKKQNARKIGEEYQKRKEETQLDWQVQEAYAALKTAQKTLQESIRSAEANVKAREARLTDVLHTKAQFKKPT